MISRPAHAQRRRRDEAGSVDSLSWQISLVTVGPGSEAFSWFGHSALLVADPRTGEQRLFDYGVVDPGAATVRGLLTGTVKAHPAMRNARVKLASWAASGRTIVIQRLALSQEQRTRVVLRLFGDRRDAGYYRYDLQHDNCTTRIRALLDEATGGALRRAGSTATGLTLRTIGARQLGTSWVIAAADILLNDSFDQPASRWDAALYPEPLSRLVAAAIVDDDHGGTRPLEASRSTEPASMVPRTAPVARDPFAFFLVGLTLATIALLLAWGVQRGHRVARILLGLGSALLGGALGLVGAVLAAGRFLTSYPFAQHNENLLLLNPVLLAAIPLGLWYAAGRERATRPLGQLFALGTIAGLLTLALKTTTYSTQDNWRTVWLCWPPLLGFAFSYQLTARPAPTSSHLRSRAP